MVLVYSEKEKKKEKKQQPLVLNENTLMSATSTATMQVLTATPKKEMPKKDVVEKEDEGLEKEEKLDILKDVSTKEEAIALYKNMGLERRYLEAKNWIKQYESFAEEITEKFGLGTTFEIDGVGYRLGVQKWLYINIENPKVIIQSTRSVCPVSGKKMQRTFSKKDAKEAGIELDVNK